MFNRLQEMLFLYQAGKYYFSKDIMKNKDALFTSYFLTGLDLFFLTNILHDLYVIRFGQFLFKSPDFMIQGLVLILILFGIVIFYFHRNTSFEQYVYDFNKKQNAFKKSVTIVVQLTAFSMMVIFYLLGSRVNEVLFLLLLMLLTPPTTP